MTGCGVALQGGQDEDPCCLALGIFPLTFTEQTGGWEGSPPRTLSKRLKIEIISEGIHTLHRLECQVILTNKFFWSWKKGNCSALLWQEKMLLNYRKRDKNWGWKSTDDFFSTTWAWIDAKIQVFGHTFKKGNAEKQIQILLQQLEHVKATRGRAGDTGEQTPSTLRS